MNTLQLESIRGESLRIRPDQVIMGYRWRTLNTKLWIAEAGKRFRSVTCKDPREEIYNALRESGCLMRCDTWIRNIGWRESLIGRKYIAGYDGMDLTLKAPVLDRNKLAVKPAWNESSKTIPELIAGL